MMKTFGKALLFGFLLWLCIFMTAFLMYSVRKSDPIFFETLMTLTITFFSVTASVLFFRKTPVSVAYGLLLGLLWALMNVLIDLPAFLWGPMKMPVLRYMQDIGLTYLAIPMITTGFGFFTSPKK